MRFSTNKLASLAHNDKYHFGIFLILLIGLSYLMMVFYMPENKIYLGYDVYFHFRRLSSLMEALQHNAYPVYLDFDGALDFGHATKWFYPDFMLLPFAWLGNKTDIVFAYRCMIFCYTILCGILTYVCCRNISRSPFFLFCVSILFTFSLYRLSNLFYRAALAEAIAMTFLPLALLGAYHVIKGDYRKWYLLTIGFSLILMTHLLSSVMTLITIIIFILIFYKEIRTTPKRLNYLFIAGGTAFLISAAYLFPMIEQMCSNSFKYNTPHIALWPENNSFSILETIWGMFNGLNLGDINQMSCTGILLTILIALRLFIYGKSKKLQFIDILVLVGLSYIFVASNLFPWKIFPFSKIKFIQFPSRFFIFSTLFFSIGGAYYLRKLLIGKKRRYIGLSGVLFTIVAIMLMNGKVFTESVFLKNTGLFGITPNESNYYHLANQDYTPAKFPSLKYIKERAGKTENLHSDTKITDFKRNYNTTSFGIALNSKEDVIEIPRYYYKGYSVFLNGNEIPYKQSDKGLLEFTAKGSGKVEVIYTGTFLQRYSHYISIIALLCLMIFIYRTQ